MRNLWTWRKQPSSMTGRKSVWELLDSLNVFIFFFQELVVALSHLVVQYESNFCTVALQFIEEEKNYSVPSPANTTGTHLATPAPCLPNFTAAAAKTCQQSQLMPFLHIVLAFFFLLLLTTTWLEKDFPVWNRWDGGGDEACFSKYVLRLSITGFRINLRRSSRDLKLEISFSSQSGV